MHEFISDLNIDGYIIERFVPLGIGSKIKDEAVSGRQIKELYRLIFSKCGVEFDSDENARYHAIQVRSGEGSFSELLGALCIVGTDGMAILPDGRVLPCRRFYLPVGNLLEDSLYDIWDTSEVLIKVRNRDNLEGKCKVCDLDDCRGCRAIAYAITGNYLNEDIQCWLEGKDVLEVIDRRK